MVFFFRLDKIRFCIFIRKRKRLRSQFTNLYYLFTILQLSHMACTESCIFIRKKRRCFRSNFANLYYLSRMQMSDDI